MKVYVIEEFERQDEYFEYSSRVLNVYANQTTAIQKAREHAINNVDSFGYMREDPADGSLKYYCCLDADPSNEADYAKYMTITVTEHELEEDK